MTDTPHFTALLDKAMSQPLTQIDRLRLHVADTSSTWDQPDDLEQLLSEIDAAIAEAVKAEREACAKLCEERFGPNGTYEARITRPDGSEAKIVKASYAVDHGQWVPQCAAKEIRERGAK